MKSYKTGIWALLCAIIFLSCGKDDETEDYAAWKVENEEVIFDLLKNTSYTRLESFSKAGSIFYKVLTKGEGTEQIYYTDKVKVYYTGTFIDGTVFDQSEPPYNAPAQFSVSATADGFGTALQHMVVGDRWEIWVPYELGYGSSGQKDATGSYYVIPPYSTLKFEVEVVEIVKE
ncbi:MAG: FKBP-type peptidyl-prolyl cis-trans isomerase [Tannerellaceae bacterium]|jgi:peptidylprolyl isomerase/FKBP-type peptidyl-prolyl cis-trans isomerase FklB|nr:FKBP-type peptidyl-prolyl cis-trans isomerase [Tannerellaceae bacterium]